MPQRSPNTYASCNIIVSFVFVFLFFDFVRFRFYFCFLFSAESYSFQSVRRLVLTVQVGAMDKLTIIELSQPNCATPFHGGPQMVYTAWSSMTTLTDKRLVEWRGAKPRKWMYG
jgi:hypothetical protein